MQDTVIPWTAGAGCPNWLVKLSMIVVGPMILVSILGRVTYVRQSLITDEGAATNPRRKPPKEQSTLEITYRGTVKRPMLEGLVVLVGENDTAEATLEDTGGAS